MYAQLAQEFVREPASTKSLSTRQAQLIDDDWSPTKVGKHSLYVYVCVHLCVCVFMYVSMCVHACTYVIVYMFA